MSLSPGSRNALRNKRPLKTCETSFVVDDDDIEVEADYRAHPGSPATRTDPKDDGEIEIEAVRLDGKEVLVSSLSKKQREHIEEAITEQENGWGDEAEDYEPEQRP